ncbi:hypothetical protein TGGT1_259540 [Toxoplasma gondii GT1]|uniref:Transmembrane protein n=2 Tax=Toxoplasma gondii TaxID=5811 RepID=S7UYT6_TOXGG|nr:hypothetical protein TGGT1_259540 [Toxoplasma gondii GT1]KAF4641250.1 hypothetical protein TGRH88_070600 [Toxoplasma gondii]
MLAFGLVLILVRCIWSLQLCAVKCAHTDIAAYPVDFSISLESCGVLCERRSRPLFQSTGVSRGFLDSHLFFLDLWHVCALNVCGFVNLQCGLVSYFLLLESPARLTHWTLSPVSSNRPQFFSRKLCASRSILPQLNTREAVPYLLRLTNF